MLEVILHHLIVLVLFLGVLYFYDRYLQKIITDLLSGKKRIVVEYKKEESSRGE
jgi:predicted Holliday junction resolvase-like endonuclease